MTQNYSTQAQPYTNPIIPSIPPSSNPRGELIFSSRVHAAFREGYERYRDSYERKRQGGRAATASGGGMSEDGTPVKGVVGRFLTKLKSPFGGDSADVSLAPTPGTETPTGEPVPNTIGSASGTGTGTLRGRTISSAGTTPSSSRRSSPGPNSLGSLGKKSSKRKGGKISRQGTPLLEIVENLGATGIAGAVAENVGDSSVSGAASNEITEETRSGRNVGWRRATGTPEGSGGIFDTPAPGLDMGPGTNDSAEDSTQVGFAKRGNLVSRRGRRRSSLGNIY